MYSTFTLVAKTAQISHLSHSRVERKCSMSFVVVFPSLLFAHYTPYDAVVLSSCLTDTIIIIIFLLKLTLSAFSFSSSLLAAWEKGSGRNFMHIASRFRHTLSLCHAIYMCSPAVAAMHSFCSLFSFIIIII